MRKKLDKESALKQEAMDKLENMRTELQMIEGTDKTQMEEWKDKCRQLIDLCRVFKTENDRLEQQVNSVMIDYTASGERTLDVDDDENESNRRSSKS